MDPHLPSYLLGSYELHRGQSGRHALAFCDCGCRRLVRLTHFQDTMLKSRCCCAPHAQLTHAVCRTITTLSSSCAPVLLSRPVCPPHGGSSLCLTAPGGSLCPGAVRRSRSLSLWHLCCGLHWDAVNEDGFSTTDDLDTVVLDASPEPFLKGPDQGLFCGQLRP